MSVTSIQWTDRSINPIRARNIETGAVGHYCEKPSPGCKNCYASKWNERVRPSGKHLIGTGLEFDVRNRDKVETFLDTSKLLEVITRRKPSKFFWCDMTDIFGEWVPDEMIDQCFATMAITPQHTHQVLTKRAGRMRRHMEARALSAMRWNGWPPEWTSLDLPKQPGPGRTFPLPNVWLGVSVENQHFADERIPLLLQTPAAVRFISAEPLLGPVDIGMSSATCACCARWSSRWVRVHREVRPDFPISMMESARGVVAPAGIHRADSNLHGALRVGDMGIVPDDFTALPALDWVIVGGESGNGARPFDLAWARSLVAQCKAAGVACFVKQLGSRPMHYDLGDISRYPLTDRKGGEPAEWPAELRIREFPEARA